MSKPKKRISFLNLFFIALLLLFITGFFLSIKLQANNEEAISQFYRRATWNTNQLVIRNKDFYFNSKLYQAQAIDIKDYQFSYDLLWQRLEVILTSQEIEPFRKSYPTLTSTIQSYFDLIKSFDESISQNMNLTSDEFIKNLNEAEKIAQDLEYKLGDIATIKLSSDITTNSTMIQAWQLLSFIISILIGIFFLLMTKKSSHLAKHDTLTKLGNRRALQEYTDQMFNTGTSLAIMSIDLKKFKIINDQIGYQVGDRVLLTFSEKISNISGYKAFRLGGDEFVLVCPFRGSLDNLQERTQQVKDQLTFPFKTREFIFPVEIRVGVSFGSKDDNITSNELVDQSIMAMNECKVTKRDLVMYHEIVPMLVKNKQKSHMLKSYIKTEKNCPLSIVLTPLYDEETGEQKLKELSLFWKKDQSSCSLNWLADERVDLKLLPSLLVKASQNSDHPVLLKLSHSYQIEQLMKTDAKSLLKKQRIILGLPLLSGLTDDQIDLITKEDLLIAVETMRSDEYAHFPNLSNIRFWVPKTLPITEGKFKALVDLATAYDQITLVGRQDEADILDDV